MKNVWTIARETISQCLRMKIAVVFIVLLGVSLFALPRMMTGDGTLAGAIRSFLSYGLTITGVLLSLVSVLTMAALLKEELDNKYFMILMVKPLSRWEYILGRWLGVVLLNGMLLAIAGTAMYLYVQQLRERDTVPGSGVAVRPLDRQEVETEVLTARTEIRPEPFDDLYDQYVEHRLETLRKEHRYEEAVALYQEGARRPISEEEAQQRLEDDLRREAKLYLDTLGPGQVRRWKFPMIRPVQSTVTVTGEVAQKAINRLAYRIQAPDSFVGRLVNNGPVKVNGVRGYVIVTRPGAVDVRFEEDQEGFRDIERLQPGDRVDLASEPTIQVRYKVSVLQQSAEITSLPSIVLVGTNPANATYGRRGDTPVGTRTTVTFPAEEFMATSEKTETSEGDENLFYVIYEHSSYLPNGRIAPSIRLPRDEISVLYRADSFAWNFLRTLILLFVQLAFLAALTAVLASWVSFPVATFAVLVILLVGLMLGWLDENVFKLVGGARIGGDLSPFWWLGYGILTALKFMIPQMSQTMPSETLADGILIPWATVGKRVGVSLVLQTGIYLLLACLIFRYRELAKVQV